MRQKVVDGTIALTAIGVSPFIRDAKRCHNAWEWRLEALKGDRP